MYYLGIDPGKKGGIALLHDTDIHGSWDFDKDVLLYVAESLSTVEEASRCCLERVHAMPKQGSVSMFTFGTGYGWIMGVLDAFEISYQTIEPRKWKAEFGLNSDKAKSIDVCRQLFPAADLIPKGCRTPHDGIAEALLMAEYARRKL